MQLEFQGEGRWLPLSGTALSNFFRFSGALLGPNLPPPVWQPLPFYDFTALVRLPDPAQGASEWYVTRGDRFFRPDAFGASIQALNATAPLRLTAANVASYLHFWLHFTTTPQRYVLLNVPTPELADDAAAERDPVLRGIVLESQQPNGFVVSATAYHKGTIRRRNFWVSLDGEVNETSSVPLLAPVKKPTTHSAA